MANLERLCRLFSESPETLSNRDPGALIQAFRWCRRHGLAPWVLSRLPVSAWADWDCRSEVADFYATHWVGTQSHLAETIRVVTAFRNACIDCLPFKGLMWSQMFYTTLQARKLGDLDLIVRKRDFRKAMDLLASLGFVRSGRLPLGLGALLQFEHGLSFQRERLAVDLHHTVAIHPSLRLSVESLFESGAIMEIKGHAFLTMNRARSLQASLLGIVRDAGLCRLGFKQIVDTWRILETSPEVLDELWSFSRSDGSWKPCCHALALSLGLLYDNDLPKSYERLPFRMSRIEALKYVGTSNWLSNKWWSWQAMEGPVWRSAVFWLLGLPVRVAAFR